MQGDLILLVLTGALLHAGWNALIKSGRSKLLDTVVITTVGAILATPLVIWLPIPEPMCWLYLGSSVLIHTGYFGLLTLSYRYGDLSIVYPLMRGTAPIIVAVLSGWILGETPSALGWTAIGLLSGGIGLLGLPHLRPGSLSRRGVSFALLTAVVIVAYTLVDGIGARLSGNAWSYVSWMFVLNAVPLIVLAAHQTSPRTFLLHFVSHWQRGLVGGVAVIGSYGIALHAMTVAPIALIAALRETSVIFAAMFAVSLRETLGIWRWTAILLVAGGVVLLKHA